MTEEEIHVLDLLGEAWNEFSKLPNSHPMDNEEFVHHIHILQRQVLAREGRRAMGYSWDKCDK